MNQLYSTHYYNPTSTNRPTHPTQNHQMGSHQNNMIRPQQQFVYFMQPTQLPQIIPQAQVMMQPGAPAPTFNQMVTNTFNVTDFSNIQHQAVANNGQAVNNTSYSLYSHMAPYANAPYTPQNFLPSPVMAPISPEHNIRPEMAADQGTSRYMTYSMQPSQSTEALLEFGSRMGQELSASSSDIINSKRKDQGVLVPTDEYKEEDFGPSGEVFVIRAGAKFPNMFMVFTKLNYIVNFLQFWFSDNVLKHDRHAAATASTNKGFWTVDLLLDYPKLKHAKIGRSELILALHLHTSFLRLVYLPEDTLGFFRVDLKYYYEDENQIRLEGYLDEGTVQRMVEEKSVYPYISQLIHETNIQPSPANSIEPGSWAKYQEQTGTIRYPRKVVQIAPHMAAVQPDTATTYYPTVPQASLPIQQAHDMNQLSDMVSTNMHLNHQNPVTHTEPATGGVWRPATTQNSPPAPSPTTSSLLSQLEPTSRR